MDKRNCGCPDLCSRKSSQSLGKDSVLGESQSQTVPVGAVVLSLGWDGGLTWV